MYLQSRMIRAWCERDSIHSRARAVIIWNFSSQSVSINIFLYVCIWWFIVPSELPGRHLRLPYVHGFSKQTHITLIGFVKRNSYMLSKIPPSSFTPPPLSYTYIMFPNHKHYVLFVKNILLVTPYLRGWVMYNLIACFYLKYILEFSYLHLVLLKYLKIILHFKKIVCKGSLYFCYPPNKSCIWSNIEAHHLSY